MAPPPASLAQIHERFSTETNAAIAASVEMGVWQTTLKADATCAGIGLHSGSDITMTLRPAPADTGIVFIRSDVENSVEAFIPAVCGSVCDVTLSSKIGNKYGNVVGTVEHLMAALAGLRIDNAIIEIDGPEVPIMDGSAQPFVELIEQAGICELPTSRRVLRIKKPIRVERDDAYCELVPDEASVFEAEIDFESNAIGRQSYAMKLQEGGFDDNVSSARTFCMLAQVEAMHSAGLALGGSVDNAVVIDGDKVMNEEGLRSSSEFVQHKLLDAIGDLYLLGLHVVGRYRGYKSGHSLHNKLLNALFMEPEAFEIVSLAGDEAVLAAE
jgi:UDP-3-O-[3-hydroxymyristoyl] N-acetylglucosamine deacetylase